MGVIHLHVTVYIIKCQTSENLKLKIDQNVPSLCQRPNFENVSHAAHRIARLSSGAGSESEKGGIMGSDSSYVYTPETDYQEFIDSDLPSSEVTIAFILIICRW
jgi:hypothetical protein